jgi:hypothetical protein
MRTFTIFLGVVTLLLLSVGQSVAVPPAAPWSEDAPALPDRVPSVSSGTDGVRAGASIGVLAGADYLVKMQADFTEDNAGNGNPDSPVNDPDDAGWDWSSTVFYHSAAASPTNLYGVTALGLYHAYLISPSASYFTAMKDAADRIVADPGIRTSSDMVFLMLFDDLAGVPGTTYQDAARVKFVNVLTAHGGSGGSFAAWLRDVRGITQGYPNGIIPWDLGSYAVAASMLDARYPGNGYDNDCDGIAEVLWQDSFNDSPGLFDVVDDAGWDPMYGNVNYWWYNLGISGLIDAFRASGSHAAEIPGLVTRIEASIAPSGAVCMCYGVHTGDEDWQTTAYAMASLGAYNPTYADDLDAMAGYMLATQDVSGAWVYGNGTHYPEVGAEASSGLAFASSTVGPVAPSGCMMAGSDCLTIPFDIARYDGAQMRAFSVTFTLSPQLMLCGSLTASITQGTYLTGNTNFQRVSNGGGSYTVDCAILGMPCGVTTPTGNLFNVQVKKSGGDATGTITVTSVRLRDCSNGPLPVVAGPPASITIDYTAPVAITNLAAAQQIASNDADGTTKILLSFTTPGDAVETKVFRAPFGVGDGSSAYPEYNDVGGAGAPTPAAYPPGAPWALTAVTASGVTDEPATRGYWYYVAYTKDACGNWSVASNMTGGALNYHLGDVAPVPTGNNIVTVPDIAELGLHYGMFAPAVNYLDVGPTTTNLPNGRPLTDNLIDLEDLMMFAINYETVGFQGDLPQMIAIGAPASGPVGLAVLTKISQVRVGQTVEVPVVLTGDPNGVQGVRAVMNYNPATLSYESSEVTGPIGAAPHFFKDIAATGKVDLSVALLGHGAGVQGSGTVFTVRFRALRDGASGVSLSDCKVRDTQNRELLKRPGTVSGRTEEPAQLTLQTAILRLGDARPNPFNAKTTISYDLPQASPVQIVIYDVAGRIVRTLVDGVVPAGSHHAEWDGRDDSGRPLSSGIYFYGMKAGAYQSQKRMTLLK